jgi:hypothetical protein
VKVTALIPDTLVRDIQSLSKGKNITQSLIFALSEWVANQKIKSLNKKISVHPLSFQSNYSASGIRELNRNK